MKTYRTNAGTELPLLNLKGKDYLEVKFRIVWFREEHPDWSIETEMMSVTDVSAYARATVKDEKGRIVATSHKFENVQGFPDFIEKAETGAIGRALALIGYGTQFCADELDEGKRIVDSPNDTTVVKNTSPQTQSVALKAPLQPTEPGEFVIDFGRKYKGKKLKELPKAEAEAYIQWLESSALREGTTLSMQVQSLKKAAEQFYKAELSDEVAESNPPQKNVLSDIRKERDSVDADSGEYVPQAGKLAILGKKLKEHDAYELEQYLVWMENKVHATGKPFDGNMGELHKQIKRYIQKKLERPAAFDGNNSA
jgi:hypothetical protein